jgi:ribosomal protein L11 methyltransferase
MYHTVLRVTCDITFAEILIAELSEAGFDTFLENETGFEAYAEGQRYDARRINELQKKYEAVRPLNFSFDRIAERNWNEEWEKSYEPIIIDDRCLIRAQFHKPEKQYPYEIIITPKMSFGTGHHQTTYLMVKNQMEIDHKSKLVMDAGCGTAVLSIMAAKLGARQVEAFDIDDWSVLNGNENAAVNDCPNIRIRKGKISALTFNENFDIILANINKNTLWEEIPLYSAYLNSGGHLLLSGFYAEDCDDLSARAADHKLALLSNTTRDHWASLLFRHS